MQQRPWQASPEEVSGAAGALEAGCLAGQDTWPNALLQVVEKWEAVTEVDVQTPLEVYQELKGEQPPCPVGQVPPCWTSPLSAAVI